MEGLTFDTLVFCQYDRKHVCKLSRKHLHEAKCPTRLLGGGGLSGQPNCCPSRLHPHVAPDGAPHDRSDRWESDLSYRATKSSCLASHALKPYIAARTPTANHQGSERPWWRTGCRIKTKLEPKQERKKIKASKYKDLQELLPYVPPIHHEFYKKLDYEGNPRAKTRSQTIQVEVPQPQVSEPNDEGADSIENGGNCYETDSD
ncbi:hypothetical protein J6590_070164 [Homalodisca vitripennis]|nr:hypothetical protein J6590_070164 [Homalodisca vitripennis]